MTRASSIFWTAQKILKLMFWTAEGQPGIEHAELWAESKFHRFHPADAMRHIAFLDQQGHNITIWREAKTPTLHKLYKFYMPLRWHDIFIPPWPRCPSVLLTVHDRFVGGPQFGRCSCAAVWFWNRKTFQQFVPVRQPGVGRNHSGAGYSLCWSFSLGERPQFAWNTDHSWARRDA